MEKRIIELETKVAYQDYTLEKLNDVIIKQQDQLDTMQKKLSTIEKHLKNLTC